MNIVSFLCPRPDHPRWCDYLSLLNALQWSCDRLGLRHVVLTDDPTLPFELFCHRYHHNLMRACTQAQSDWIQEGDWKGNDTLFVGADTLMLKQPEESFAGRYDLAVTLRLDGGKHPINTGAIVIREISRPKVGLVFAEVAKQTKFHWCADQEALADALSPIPEQCGMYKRAGCRVAFLPMEQFNVRPLKVNQPMEGFPLLHFRGKWDRKEIMVPWAQKWLGYPG